MLACHYEFEKTLEDMLWFLNHWGLTSLLTQSHSLISTECFQKEIVSSNFKLDYHITACIIWFIILGLLCMTDRSEESIVIQGHLQILSVSGYNNKSRTGKLYYCNDSATIQLWRFCTISVTNMQPSLFFNASSALHYAYMCMY